MKLKSLESRLQAEQNALRTTRYLQPWIHRYLPDDAFRTIVVIVVLLMITTIVKNLFMFADSMLLARVVQLVVFDLRKKLYHHALRMDLHEFGEQRVGAMMSRFNVDLGFLERGLTCLFGKAVREPMKGIACLVGAAVICWRLLLFSLLLTPLAAFLIRTLAGSIKRANRRAMEENSQLMGVLSESFGGMQTIKAFTMEKYERRRFHQVSKACLRKAMRDRILQLAVSSHDRDPGNGRGVHGPDRWCLSGVERRDASAGPSHVRTAAEHRRADVLLWPLDRYERSGSKTVGCVQRHSRWNRSRRTDLSRVGPETIDRGPRRLPAGSAPASAFDLRSRQFPLHSRSARFVEISTSRCVTERPCASSDRMAAGRRPWSTSCPDSTIPCPAVCGWMIWTSVSCG